MHHACTVDVAVTINFLKRRHQTVVKVVANGSVWSLYIQFLGVIILSETLAVLVLSVSLVGRIFKPAPLLYCIGEGTVH